MKPIMLQDVCGVFETLTRIARITHGSVMPGPWMGREEKL